MTDTYQGRLEGFFIAAFSVDEIQQLLQRLGPDGESLRNGLRNPQTASLAVYVAELVDGLERHQLVDAEFFARLTDLRPRRARELIGLAAAWAIALPQPSSEVRMLFLGASALPEWDFKIGTEVDAIQRSLQRSEYGSRFVLKAIERTDPALFFDEVLLFRPNILHFAGHAKPGGELYVHGAAGHTTIPIDALSKLFWSLRADLQCIFFNACASIDTAKKTTDISGCITIGIDGDVANETCIDFSQQFYLALSHGRSILSAFTFARGFVVAMHGGDALRFELCHAPEVDPDAVHFAG